MKRRKFIALVGGASAWPLLAQAQQSSGRTWRVGYLHPGSTSPGPSMTAINAWKRTMGELGYIEGQNLIVDLRMAEGDFGRLPQLAQDLVAAKPDVIMANGTDSIAAVRRATTSIPIVMAPAGDPISSGFVKSLARPGGRITGVANMTDDYAPKTVELLRELLPGVRRVAVLMSASLTHPIWYRTVEAAAATVGLDLVPVIARTAADLDAAFAAIAEAKCDAMIVLTDPVRLRILPLAAAARLPAIYQVGENVDIGGLISYGPNYTALIAHAAVYVDEIFKGADPAELPVEQPTTFELKVNLKTAKELGLTIPPTLLARADKVIE